jgi:acyl carrier protein
MDTRTIQDRLVEFLGTLTGRETFSEDTDLFAAGVTDSLTMMDFLVFIESEYRIRLGFGDLTPDVFRTPKTVAQLISDRMTESPRTAA